MVFFLLLTNLIRNNILQEYDNAILYYFRTATNPAQPIAPVWITEMFRDITSLGSETVLSLLVIIISIYLLLKKKIDILYLVLTTSIGGFIVDLILKYAFARERPDMILHLTYVTSKSFPSGHSMMSAAIYLSLASIIARTQNNLNIRLYLIISASILTFLIGLSRIYLGVHYPSDVFGGWIAGSIWAIICWMLGRYFKKENSTEENDFH